MSTGLRRRARDRGGHCDRVAYSKPGRRARDARRYRNPAASEPPRHSTRRSAGSRPPRRLTDGQPSTLGRVVGLPGDWPNATWLEVGHRQHERARPRGLLGCGLGVRGGGPSALISQLLAAGHIGLEAVVEYRGRRIFRGYAAIRHPDDPFEEISGIGRGRRLLFQEVPERKSGKNRLHIDVHSEPGGLDELVTRLEKLGATRIGEVDEGPAGRWWVMQDPEGNEFCAA